MGTGLEHEISEAGSQFQEAGCRDPVAQDGASPGTGVEGYGVSGVDRPVEPRHPAALNADPRIGDGTIDLDDRSGGSGAADDEGARGIGLLGDLLEVEREVDGEDEPADGGGHQRGVRGPLEVLVVQVIGSLEVRGHLADAERGHHAAVGARPAGGAPVDDAPAVPHPVAQWDDLARGAAVARREPHLAELFGEGQGAAGVADVGEHVERPCLAAQKVAAEESAVANWVVHVLRRERRRARVEVLHLDQGIAPVGDSVLLKGGNHRPLLRSVR